MVFSRRMSSATPMIRVRLEDLLGDLNEVERKNAPSSLFYSGDLEVFGAGLRVSVVGTRQPSALGVKRAEDLVRALVKKGVVVVSGLAEGVDAVAHRAAIAAGGKTVAVVGSGLDRPFPGSNRELWASIIADHLAISQFPPGTPPIRTNFPQRNRTMALLADATIIVEAGEGSGTIHQGWEALRLGRPLFLLESLSQRSDLPWPAEMIRYGAEILTKANLAAALEEIPRRPRGEPAF